MRRDDLIHYFMHTAGMTRNQAVEEIAERIGRSASGIYKWPEQLDRARQCIAQVLTGGVLQADVPQGVAPVLRRRAEEAVRAARAAEAAEATARAAVIAEHGAAAEELGA